MGGGGGERGRLRERGWEGGCGGGGRRGGVVGQAEGKGLGGRLRGRGRRGGGGGNSMVAGSRSSKGTEPEGQRR